MPDRIQAGRQTLRQRTCDRLNKDQILIVEDEALIGYDLADLLEEAGYEIHGPYANVDDALVAVQEAELSLAILDVNLGDGETSQRIAEDLTRDGTPILFVSGYSIAGSTVLRNFPSAARLSKPWDPVELLATIRKVSRTPPTLIGA